MEISLRNLPNDGLPVHGVISLGLLNARMNEARANDVEFVEAPRIEVTVRPELGGAELVGRVYSRYQQPCARCLEFVSESVEVPIRVTLKPKTLAEPRHKETHMQEFVDDSGIIYFEGSTVNIEDFVQEILIVALPSLGPAHPGCKGLQYRPAAQSADTPHSLGELLKKAGVK